MRSKTSTLRVKKALLLHWRGGNWNENWFPWLIEELEKKWYEVFSPNLPSTNSPKLSLQLEEVSKYKDILKPWDIVIWHSLGCHLAIYFEEEYNLRWLNNIFVGPTYNWIMQELWKEVYWEAYDNFKEYFNRGVEYKNLWNKYTLFLSDNDPFIKINSAKKYYSKFKNLEFKYFKWYGHFNNDAWILEIPEILDYL